ncbi:MAG TPA: phosphate ABC transporter, permease protein PstA, partial [Mycolicibacterium fallax]|nr:phosphate ABC transporter, permease protein PstA [Mycolicibacterium fallax]
MTQTVDRPVKRPTFEGLSLRRKLVDNTATVLVTASVLVALVPLAWVLWATVSKGISVVTSVDWWWKSQAGITAFEAGGGAYHAIV